MNEGRYQVTLSHYGHELSQESFTSFPEALGRAIKLREACNHSPFHWVRLWSPDRADGNLVEGQMMHFDGLSPEEREQWDEYR